jgi:hypothetical protein
LRSVVKKSSIVLDFFVWAKELSAKNIHKKYFLFRVESVYRIKPFTPELRNVADVSLITKRLKWRCGSG